MNYLLLLRKEGRSHRQTKNCPLPADRLQKWESCHCHMTRWHSCMQYSRSTLGFFGAFVNTSSICHSAIASANGTNHGLQHHS